MKIQLQAKQMKFVLGNLFQVVTNTSVLPILSMTVIEVKDKKVTFTVTDLETLLQYTMDTETNGEHKFCIESKLLSSFLKNAIEENCTLEINDKHKITLKSGVFSVRIQGNPNEIDNYPIMPVIKDAKTFNIEYATLFPHISAALKFVSNDDLRPSMTGVFFHTHDSKLNIAATDAHCLYWNTVCKMEQNIDAFILPQKSAYLFNLNFKNKMVSVFVSENHVTFKSDTTTLIARKIDAKYPDYKVVIPVNHQCFYMKRKQLVSLLKLSSIYTNRATYQICFQVINDTIKVYAEDIDFGIEFDYVVPIYNHTDKMADYTFAINLKFLKKTLELNKDEFIKISHTSISTKAIVIDDKFLLMPLMLNN